MLKQLQAIHCSSIKKQALFSESMRALDLSKEAMVGRVLKRLHEWDAGLRKRERDR